MTPSRLAWLALLALGALVSLLIALRSRRVPALRGAAVACACFVVLDAGRWWGLGGVADVVAFVVMPGCWGVLLVSQRAQGAAPLGEGVSGGLLDGRGRRALGGVAGGALGGAARPALDAGLVTSDAAGNEGAGGAEHRPHHSHARALAPPLVCLLYASLLLLARHQPAVREHWQAALQVPRLAVGAWALWVVVGWRKDEGPERASPSPSLGGSEDLRDPSTVEGKPAGPLAQPSRLIGVVMALGCAACVVGGLWGEDWGGVRVLSAVSWGIVAVVATRAR